jgi:DNA-binding HxlR family transcriptional regulator
MIMQESLDFNAHKLARTNDPATSVEAAESAEFLVGKHHGLIMDALTDFGMMAPEQIADRVGKMDKVEVCRRVNELEKAGLITDTGQKHVNRSGRKARVFRAR